MAYLIVDLQGFKDNKNEFIIKEFAIATPEYTMMFLVKPPYSYSVLSSEEKKQVRWIERNRGILWREGFIDIREFKRVIKPFLENKDIFVKGNEKIKWIKDICSNCNIVDLSADECPNLATLQKFYSTGKLNEDVNDVHCSKKEFYPFNCMFHKNKCALNNVIILRKWMIDEKKCI